MDDSRESSCTSDGSLAEQEYAEVQEHHLREVNFNKINVQHSSQLSALRIESNATLAQFSVPPTPPTSRTDAARLMEQLQVVTDNLVEIGKSQIPIAARFLEFVRRARLLRARLASIGVGRDTHGLAFVNQDEIIRMVASSGCNRALRIFKRQSLSRAAPKTEAQQRAVKAAAPPARKPRAKKVVPTPTKPDETQPDF